MKNLTQASMNLNLICFRIAFYPNLIKKLFPKIKFILGNKKWSRRESNPRPNK